MEETTITGQHKQLFADAINNGKIKMWEDPGHRWLQVPMPLINALKKEKELKISGYSYKDKENAYLEEDCDLTAFVNCFPYLNFRDMFSNGQIEQKYQESIFIRKLNHF